MSQIEFLKSLSALLPELIITGAICLVILTDMFVSLERSRNVACAIGGAGLLLALAMLPFCGFCACHPSAAGAEYFLGSFLHDRLAILFKAIFIAGGIITLFLSIRSAELQRFRFGEFVALLLGVIFSACVLASANNILLFVTALETLSLCSYVLAGFLKQERRSAEAALKYVIYGAVASAVMLFGFSYLYGLSGTLELSSSVVALAKALFIDGLAGGGIGVLIFLLLLTGLGFKIAMVPFHFWCPDVYQGAPTPITAMLSVVSKSAGIAALLRLFAPIAANAVIAEHIFPTGALGSVPLLLGLLAVITMTYGNLVAIRQTDVKRMLAYSAIAHAGYILMALSVVREASFQAAVVYLAVYLFMNLGAFFVIIALGNQSGSFELSSFRGAAYSSPVLFGVLFICLAALTGLPPTAGFSAKFVLFKVVVSEGLAGMEGGALTAYSWFYLSLATIGVLNSAVSLYYYMKLCQVMAFQLPESGSAPFNVPLIDRIGAVAFAVPVLLLLNVGPLLDISLKLFSPVAVSVIF